MNTNADFERHVSAWLADGPTELNDRVLRDALRDVHLTHQRRRWPASWRTSLMRTRSWVAAAVAVTAIAIGGLSTLRSVPGIGSSSQAPTASAAPSAPVSSSSAPIVSFTSPLYGYTVDVPEGWAVTAATVQWAPGTDPSADVFAAPVSQSPNFDDVYVAVQPVPPGMTPAAWMQAYAEHVAASGRDCKGPVEAWRDAVVGSLPIRRMDLECPLLVTDVAFVLDGMGYVMSGNRVVISQFLDGFATAAAPVSFTSPLYGYTVSAPAGWPGVDPATVPWPNGDVADTAHPEWFDVFPFDPTRQDIGFVGVAAQTLPEGSTPEAWLLEVAQRQASSSFACRGPVEDWVDEPRLVAMVGTMSHARRIDITCAGELDGEDFTGWRYAQVAFVVDRTGYLVSGGPEGLDPLVDSFRPAPSG